jgi:glycosyltransferase involved in cell wall biosynthesis
METSLKLAFVGGGTYADAYVNSLKRHASDRILFLGYQSGEILGELFSNAYLYVLPSTIEGLSLSLLEAMAYGNCVLTSDIPENLELVSRHGFSFKSGDIEHLRYMMNYLIRHPQLVESTAKANRSYIQVHYTWEIVTDQTEKLFTDLLNGSHKTMKDQN